VNLSSSEGVPLSIMEALAMGVPVVATAAGGTGEMVDETVGELLEVDVDAVTAGSAIRRVVDEGARLREAARARFSEEGSSNVAMDALHRHVPDFLVVPD
jgi:glycosyltransferase involved in cell wall biosynthesis